jgi:hypothetical protein
VLYGVRPGPPGLGPGIPIEFPPEGLAGCAHTGAEKASAATTATPVRRCFIVLILPCNLRGAVWVPTRPNSLFIVRRALGVKTAPSGASRYSKAVCSFSRFGNQN